MDNETEELEISVQETIETAPTGAEVNETRSPRTTTPPPETSGQTKATESDEAHRKGSDRKGRRRSRSRRRKRKRSPSTSPSASSSNSSSSDTSTSHSHSPPPAKKIILNSQIKTVSRFEVVTSKDKNAWRLSDDPAQYANNTKYVSDKDIQDNILVRNPVPKNLKEPLKVDSFVSNLLNDTGNTFEISRDKQLARINSRLRDVYGPLTKVLQQVDEFKQSEDTEMEFDPMAFSLALKQSVVLLRQAQGAINFQRRCSILGAITKSDSKAKTMIKDEFVEELEKSGELLFGKDFEKKMT